MIPSPKRKQNNLGRPKRELEDVRNGILIDTAHRRSVEESAATVPILSKVPSLVPKVHQQVVFKKIFAEPAEDLYRLVGIDIHETFIDASFTPAKKGEDSHQDHCNCKRF